MNSVAIGLILTGVIALILSLSIFWGIKRGLKKTLFRLAWIIVSSIILFFTVQPLSNWLNSFDLSGLNLDIFGKVTKLSDIGVNIVNSIEGGADVLQSSEELALFVECLPTLILNILLFVIMFWVLKVLLWLIWAPISTRIFDKQKLVLKKREKEQKKLKAKNPAAVMQQDQEPFVINIKQNKHRGWGAFAGFVLGLIVCAVTFSPIIGLNSIYQTVYASIMAEDESGNKVPYLTQVIDEDTRGYIESYETSIGGKILKYTGVEFFSNLMFGGLTTVNVGEEKVSLVGEVSTAAKVFKGINNLTTFDTDNINQDNLDKFIVNLKEISTDIKGSTIVYFVANHVVPYIIDDFLEQNDIVLVDGGVLDQAVIYAYKEFSKDFDFGKLQDQLTSLLDVASILNYYDLLAPIFNNEVTNLQQAVDLIGTKATNDGLADIVVDGLFNIDILKNEYPALISAGVNSIFNGLDLQYAQQDIESNQLKEDLSIIFTNIFRFCRYYSKSVNLDFGEDTVNTMSSIGIVLNTLKQGIINNQNFAQLISYFEKTLNSALKDVVDLTSIVEGVNNVEDWENELLALATPYKTIVKLVNAAPSVESIMAGEFDSHIKNVGNGLDSALTGESLLINNQNIRVALEAFLNKIDTSSFDEVLDIQIDSALTLKQQLLNNIYSLSTQQSKIKSWKNEFEYNLDLVKAVFNLNKDSFDIEKLSNSQNNQLEETGLAIDNAIKRTNLIVSGKVFSKVANYFLDKVVFPEEVDQILNIKGSSNKTVLEIVLANISSGDDIINYQQEFLKIKNVLKVDFENASFVELGSMLDNLLGSNIFTKNEVVNSVVKYYIDQETTTLDSGLKTAIDLMKNNLNSVVSYVKEFEHIEDLLAVLDAEYQTSAEQYAAFGRQFNIMSGYDGFAGLQSNIFTKEVINTFICYYFDEFITNNLQDIPQDIKDIVEDVKGNLAKAKDYNIDINYERELNNFLELADCVDGSVLDLNGDGAQDLRDIGSVLDDMKSEIITPSVIKNLIAFYIEEETASLDADLKTIVKDVVDTIKSDKTTISNYEKEFDLLLQLTDHIKSSSIDFGSVGKSFDKLQNQSSVVSRQVLESLINYFFTDFIETNLTGPEQEDFKNAVEDIAKNIPEIESFEKEFANLDLLFENVENSDIVELGAILDQIVNSNSKLIKKDPNINGIVAYFFDAYVNKNLDAEGDKDLIKVINDVKQNIALIESYTREFSYLNMLFEKVNVVNIAEIGGVLDNIAASNSKLIKKDPNMYDIVTYFFDKFIEQKLDAVEEAELIEIIDGIKANVNQIESFATEFNHLETLLNGANNTNTIAIGAVLDNIAAANSKLIKKDPNMFDMVAYFFDKFINEKLSAASDAELIEIIDGIKANVNQIESFATEFNHLETLLNGANNTNTIAIGAVLDNIAAANSKLIKKDPNMYDIVTYFFDKFISEKLNALSDAELIEVINGIKANINQIESFAAEFNHLESLLNGANNTDTTAIGGVLDNIAAANSKLIKKDPNMYDIVAYFFDKFIEEKLDAISDAELIEVINGIKANINQIESFAMEFNYLDLLLTSVESANTAEIGAKFDELVVSNSKLIKKDPNLNSLVAYFFDDYVTEKLNPTDDVDLITIINKIKANISQIVSFELEFSNLDLLFDAVNNNNLNSVGAIFDQIIASNSRLIRKNPNIKDIISYFLDDYIQTNISSSQQGLVGIISGIKANILNVENFETEFGYLEELLNVVKTSNKTQIGAYLDDLIENDSKLINRSTIDSLVRYYFETYVSDELDPTNDAVLISIVNEIKDQNISSIESFEKEFTNLELLFTNVNGADLNSIGSVLDQIIANNSKLIKRDPNINKLVSYFFDQYVLTNFDQTEDSNLILAVNGMKNNISSVESFATEINYISTLLDKVKTSTKKQIGAYLDSLVANNSKLIKKDPNMFDLVSCLFDDYVSESLNASTDAKIIEIINGIKNNISSINSFELEFENLDLLLVNVNSSSKQYVGEVFDTIVVSNSNLIQSKNLNDLVKLFFDEYVEDSLDETEDADLITIVNNIKNNVNLIESYKQEFVNLDSLFTTLSNLNPSTIGEELDELKINSKLISLQNIQQIAVYFFDNNTEEYKVEHNNSILLMRVKVAQATEFKSAFAELSTITTNLTALTNLNSMESFIYSSDVGLMIDEMAAMTHVCDKQIAYNIANTVITKFLNYVNDGYSQVAKDQMVVIMNNEVFSFNTYNPTDSIDYVGSHADENYYTDLINAMIDSLDGSY